MTSAGFSNEERAALAAIVALIIPASAEYDQPGADDPVIFADILKSGAPLRTQLSNALASVSGTLDAAGGAAFKQHFPGEANMIQALTAECYYRDIRVMKALSIETRPPFPVGYQQIPNDLSLLDPVRARGEIYRKTPLSQE